MIRFIVIFSILILFSCDKKESFCICDEYNTYERSRGVINPRHISRTEVKPYKLDSLGRRPEHACQYNEVVNDSIYINCRLEEYYK